jgi:hypothetical protein
MRRGSSLRCEGVVNLLDVVECVQCKAFIFGGHGPGGVDELGHLWTEAEVGILEIAEDVHESHCGTGEGRCL